MDKNVLHYVESTIDYFDYCNMDIMSKLELDDIVKDLSYNGPLIFSYVDNKQELKWILNDIIVLKYYKTYNKNVKVIEGTFET